MSPKPKSRFSVLSAQDDSKKKRFETTVDDSEEDSNDDEQIHEKQQYEDRSHAEPSLSMDNAPAPPTRTAPPLTIVTPPEEVTMKMTPQKQLSSAHLTSPVHNGTVSSPQSPSSKALDEEGNIKVCIRLRPFNNREISHKAKKVVNFIDEHTVELCHPEKKDKKWKFAYDRLYYSFDNSKRRLATQEYIFRDMGLKLVENCLDGFNSTLIAYGQTGSGKTHTVIGPHLSPNEPSEDLLRKEGLVPRICREIFKRVQQLDAQRDLHTNSSTDLLDSDSQNRRRSLTGSPHNTTLIYFRMLEIYNERVKDLLNPHIKNIKVSIQNEDDNKKSIFISAPMQIVHSFEEIAALINRGNREKQVAETQMNERSSRSHTIFQVKIEQPAPGNKKRVSLLNLVDLAGSENAKLAGTSGDTLKEGAAINKSLSALGQVIDELVANQNKKRKKKGKKSSSAENDFVSYRNSILTTILANSIGGNSKTFMLCTISPADQNFAATKSTLRYGQKTKKIKNKAVVNEDSNVKLIRELKANIETLKKQIQNGGHSGSEIRNLQQQLEESKLIQQQLAATIEEQERSHVELEELRQRLMIEEEERHRQTVLIEHLRAEKLVQKRNANTQTVLDLSAVQSIDEIEKVIITEDAEEVHSDCEEEGESHEHSGEEEHDEDSDSSDTSSSVATDSSFDDFEIASHQELDLSSPRIADVQPGMDSLDDSAFQVPFDVDNIEHENPSSDEDYSDGQVVPSSARSDMSEMDEEQSETVVTADNLMDISFAKQGNYQQPKSEPHVHTGASPEGTPQSPAMDIHNIHIEVPEEVEATVVLVEQGQQGEHISIGTETHTVATEVHDVAISPLAVPKREMCTQITPRNKLPPPASDSQFAIRLMIQGMLERFEGDHIIQALEQELESHQAKLLDSQQKYQKLEQDYNTLKASHETVTERHLKTESSVADLREKFGLTQRELEEVKLEKEKMEKKKKGGRCSIM